MSSYKLMKHTNWECKKQEQMVVAKEGSKSELETLIEKANDEGDAARIIELIVHHAVLIESWTRAHKKGRLLVFRVKDSANPNSREFEVSVGATHTPSLRRLPKSLLRDVRDDPSWRAAFKRFDAYKSRALSKTAEEGDELGDDEKTEEPRQGQDADADADGGDSDTESKQAAEPGAAAGTEEAAARVLTAARLARPVHELVRESAAVLSAADNKAARKLRKNQKRWERRQREARLNDSSLEYDESPTPARSYAAITSPERANETIPRGGESKSGQGEGEGGGAAPEHEHEPGHVLFSELSVPPPPPPPVAVAVGIATKNGSSSSPGGAGEGAATAVAVAVRIVPTLASASPAGAAAVATVTVAPKSASSSAGSGEVSHRVVAPHKPASRAESSKVVELKTVGPGYRRRSRRSGAHVKAHAHAHTQRSSAADRPQRAAPPAAAKKVTSPVAPAVPLVTKYRDALAKPNPVAAAAPARRVSHETVTAGVKFVELQTVSAAQVLAGFEAEQQMEGMSSSTVSNAPSEVEKERKVAEAPRSPKSLYAADMLLLQGMVPSPCPGPVQAPSSSSLFLTPAHDVAAVLLVHKCLEAVTELEQIEYCGYMKMQAEWRTQLASAFLVDPCAFAD